MKKILIAAMAVVMLASCNSEREYLSYKGLSMGMKAKTFTDSLAKRGFEVDSAASQPGLLVMNNVKDRYSVTIASVKDSITAVQENYTATYNDSTRQLFQTLRDAYVKELGINPFIPDRGDDHKTAVFQTDKGTVTVILENTYTPSLAVKYDQTIIGGK